MNFHEFLLLFLVLQIRFMHPPIILPKKKIKDQLQALPGTVNNNFRFVITDSNSDCESNEFLKMWFDFRKTSTTFIQLNFLGPVMKLLKAQWIFPKQTDMTRKNFVKGSSYFIMKFF